MHGWIKDDTALVNRSFCLSNCASKFLSFRVEVKNNNNNNNNNSNNNNPPSLPPSLLTQCCGCGWSTQHSAVWWSLIALPSSQHYYYTSTSHTMTTTTRFRQLFHHTHVSPIIPSSIVHIRVCVSLKEMFSPTRISFYPYCWNIFHI